MGDHYNTELHAFAKPWSPWKLNKIETKQYSINYNGEDPGWLGKFWDGQCGKGVNVVRLKLEAASTGHAVNVCVLNSHQSFKYDFKHRLENLQDTMTSLEGGV